MVLVIFIAPAVTSCVPVMEFGLATEFEIKRVSHVFAPAEETLMARCRASMAHGDPRYSPTANFEICMSSKDYHLEDDKGCRDETDKIPNLYPNSRALSDPACWYWIPYIDAP
jgi:hypothetical protein